MVPDDGNLVRHKNGISVRGRQKNAEDSWVKCDLNKKSQEVGYATYSYRWATMYFDHLIGRNPDTDTVRIDFDDSFGLEHLTISDNKLQGDSLVNHQEMPSDIELEIDPQIEMDILRATLEKKMDILTLDITHNAPNNEIAFRALDDGSCARYFQDGHDIRCSSWQNFDISKALARDDAELHIRHSWYRGLTDFISISKSPRLMWNHAELNYKHHEKLKIAVIDLRILRRLGIAYGSTTDDLGIITEYTTKHHVLVVGWLPCHSILGLLSYEEFTQLLQKSHIDLSHKDKISPTVYDRKIPFELILTSLKQKGISPCYKTRVDEQY
ncbi:hypothetical protein F4806DRAFT_506404 [Annulohypoxylon nitens]|nr:hypothetical protein F4806DRAFT_506404 [Annulohypoxylon nitens]